jgi:DNA replication protein DnaC
LCDPSTNHNAARKKHKPTTGKWFLESEQFVSWMHGRITSIWLHGIPGTGKTILSSTIIDRIDTSCKPDGG